MIVAVSFAEPIWASGHRAAPKAGHMTAVAPPARSRRILLALQGPSTHARGDSYGQTEHVPFYGELAVSETDRTTQTT